MRYLMRKFVVFSLALLVTACTGNNINYMTATGERPPLFFEVTDMGTMERFVFDTKLFSFKLPQAKPIDFTLGKGWHGMTYRDGHGISLGSMVGDIDISTDYYPQKVTEYERAILQKNLQYIKKHIRIDNHDKLYIKYYGKESYPCSVMEYTKSGKYYKNSKFMGVKCYKFNPNKTKYQSVHIRLSYSKPLDPKLAKIYTYQDLKHRAKRMLDSLYIKSWW